jgi:hypothetical protein
MVTSMPAAAQWLNVPAKDIPLLLEPLKTAGPLRSTKAPDGQRFLVRAVPQQHAPTTCHCVTSSTALM